MSIEEGRLTYFVFKKYDSVADKVVVCATRRRPSGALPTCGGEAWRGDKEDVCTFVKKLESQALCGGEDGGV